MAMPLRILGNTCKRFMSKLVRIISDGIHSVPLVIISCTGQDRNN